MFEESCRYLLGLPSPIVGHVKWEELCEDTEMSGSCKKRSIIYPSLLPLSVPYEQNKFVGAWGWDVHIEGSLCPNLVHKLRKDGWIYLTYAEGGGEVIVLTKHYLEEASCKKAYELICAYLQKCGGLVGHVYWERPVSYCVMQGFSARRD